MSRNTRKRGFVAPQPSTAVSVFADRLEALRAAGRRVDEWRTDPADQGGSEAELAVLQDAEDEAHDALIGTPAATTSEVADKVNALFRRWANGTGDLHDPLIRKAVAAWPETGHICDERDYAQTLLALYMDLTGLGEGLPVRPLVVRNPSAFYQHVKAFEAAAREEDEALIRERESGDTLSNEELERLYQARFDHLWAAMLEPSPDLDALAWKLARGIEIAHADFEGECVDDPAFISRLLGEAAWDDGRLPAIAYQDVLRLAGRHGPVTDAKPDSFDPSVFLADLEQRSGSTITLSRGGDACIAPTDLAGAGADLLAAAEAWSALSPAHKSKVRIKLRELGQ